jgi:hypothetical protein
MRQRLLPMMLALNRATPEFDFSIPLVATAVGAILGLLAFAIGVLWHITTPRSALPLLSTARRIDDHSS